MATLLAFEDNKQSPSDNILRKVRCRPTNAAVRSREHLTHEEVQALMKAADSIGRHRHRDKTLICSFAPKSEPKTAYICISNCPGYGGQVA